MNVISTTLGLEGLMVFKHASLDLIILDLVLTDVGGIHVLENVRKTSYIPLIIVAKTGDDELLNKAKKLVANESIIEPFDPADLLLCINKLFKEPKMRLLTNQ